MGLQSFVGSLSGLEVNELWEIWLVNEGDVKHQEGSKTWGVVQMHNKAVCVVSLGSFWSLSWLDHCGPARRAGVLQLYMAFLQANFGMGKFLFQLAVLSPWSAEKLMGNGEPKEEPVESDSSIYTEVTWCSWGRCEWRFREWRYRNMPLSRFVKCLKHFLMYLFVPRHNFVFVNKSGSEMPRRQSFPVQIISVFAVIYIFTLIRLFSETTLWKKT